MINAATWPWRATGNSRANIGEANKPNYNATPPIHTNTRELSALVAYLADQSDELTERLLRARNDDDELSCRVVRQFPVGDDGCKCACRRHASRRQFRYWSNDLRIGRLNQLPVNSLLLF